MTPDTVRQPVRLAVDIGGTFTDIVLVAQDGVLHESKVSTTPADPSVAVINGVRTLLKELSIHPSLVAEVLHGTTVASNTLLLHSGATTGLITTAGFRDVLEIGRIRMPEMFDLTWSKPKPLVPRRHRLEVRERIAADGSIVQPLDDADVVAVARQLVDAGIASIAICFINSYRNPVHEQKAEAAVRAAFPDISVCASYSVLPEMKEYERTSTTVVNAYLLTAMQRYIARLESGLQALGICAPLLVMTSNGGMIAAASAAEKPVLVVASGPAGGVIGAVRVAAARQERDAIAFDMGGTTAKAVIIEDGRPSMTSEYEFRDGISTSSRFIKAGGYMLKVPAIDIAEVGAGGGSLASIDNGGLLLVGPESAGADPGPACYDLGNKRPTVTDANVVLGYLNPAALAGGQLAIDRNLSVEAIGTYIAEPLGISVEDAAHGIRAVANAAMGRAIRAVTVERGRDPRDLTLIAMGGNGGIHAIDLARQLSITKVVLPPLSGVFAAVGMLGADIEHTCTKTLLADLEILPEAALSSVIQELTTEVLARLARDNYFGADVQLVWQADLRHEGQATELTVDFEPGHPRSAMRDAFIAEYVKTYGYRDDTAVELAKVRVIGRGPRKLRLAFETMVTAERAAAKSTGTRAVSFFRGEQFMDVPVLTRHDLSSVNCKGPFIIEEFDATIVVPPDAAASRDAIGSVVIELESTP